jgi:DNA-binding IclR family transcriptional regulator
MLHDPSHARLEAFLREHVESLEELLTLLALADGPLPAGELALRTRLSPALQDEALAALVRRGLAEADGNGRVRVVLADPRFSELSLVWRREAVAVLRLMNAIALERVRLGAGRAFADAFLLGKGRPDG